MRRVILICGIVILAGCAVEEEVVILEPILEEPAAPLNRSVDTACEDVTGDDGIGGTGCAVD